MASFYASSEVIVERSWVFMIHPYMDDSETVIRLDLFFVRQKKQPIGCNAHVGNEPVIFKQTEKWCFIALRSSSASLLCVGWDPERIERSVNLPVYISSSHYVFFFNFWPQEKNIDTASKRDFGGN